MPETLSTDFTVFHYSHHPVDTRGSSADTPVSGGIIHITRPPRAAKSNARRSRSTRSSATKTKTVPSPFTWGKKLFCQTGGHRPFRGADKHVPRAVSGPAVASMWILDSGWALWAASRGEAGHGAQSQSAGCVLCSMFCVLCCGAWIGPAGIQAQLLMSVAF
ncbi:hypothetical protein FIBSPDRAFT_115981 [Athelia psychrophila]|uniref:Uncharacterized protein n=1 Tax=Athelia psychrophila TaxID=1759441 RepID=A0A166CZM7_9AGAM|nr:hypothetical protein FIBSPDRAFT_115981 [Fibularhizoctonia sp. CBS 109695]